MKQTAIGALRKFTTNDPEFIAFHSGNHFDQELLGRFLSATMDEARLRFADQYAAQVLAATDLEEMNHFRQGVHRREVGRTMGFEGQRDHSAHTLNNYLLGAYFWSNSNTLADFIKNDMSLRGITPTSTNFFSLWQFVSLLHDIGYVVEGAASPNEPVQRSQLSRIGVDVICEFFNSRFWVDSKLPAPADRVAILKFTGVAPFVIEGEGFSGILEALRDTGDISWLTATVNHRVRTDGGGVVVPAGLPDAFAIWRAHYSCFGRPAMVKRIQELEAYAHKCIYDGLGSSGVRMLDHGLCSGLLCLRVSTYYYALLYGLHESDGRERSADNTTTFNAQRAFIDEARRQGGPTYIPDWWWRGVCWASAACAVHNHLQMKVGGTPLDVEEDSLAYLGILVDILQEWDRFRVVPNALGKEAPLQGVDVLLSHRAGKVVFKFPQKIATKVRESLTDALKGWERFVVVEISGPASRKPPPIRT